MKIGNLELKLPIIQGGMAIKASMSNLAAAVANEGGVGCIAGSALTMEELKEEIKKAKKLIVNEGGALAVNIMFAVTDFAEAVKTSIEAGVDIIITGAGFSRDIYEMVKGTDVKVFPIVSSPKLAKLAQKLGADAIIVEGGNAGGHLGTELDSWDIIRAVKDAVTIPVFGAGGVITPKDAERMLSLGADGIQMGSRFIASEECEVNEKFKQMYVDAKEGDVVTIMSSAGLPANAIISPFIKRLKNDSDDIKPTACDSCLKHCTHTFCVNERLRRGHDGDLNEGIFFAGKDVWKIDSIKSVKEIMDDFRPLFLKKS
ncbi:nitronate monooxygenase [Cetobacterium somerae]|uniref:NAD(P)H-dependent flavin oxidoreductase n=1 Tax=Cetobacterium sp. NK01 TaxID=2993530 RepID=UPI002116147A|nr:nitronate monooxygenase [Cetobacterium sp. NK01]MCQ8211014.1 nitronate monooxygenase [Cetobacterium sp. NK01]